MLLSLQEVLLTAQGRAQPASHMLGDSEACPSTHHLCASLSGTAQHQAGLVKHLGTPHLHNPLGVAANC